MQRANGLALGRAASCSWVRPQPAAVAVNKPLLRRKTVQPKASFGEPSADSLRSGARTLRIIVSDASFIGPEQSLVCVGNLSELGTWKPMSGAWMTKNPDSTWQTEVYLRNGFKGAVEYKLVVVSRRDQSCLWEQGDNRKLQINPPDAQHCTIVDVNCTWNKNEGGEIKATHLPPAKVPTAPTGVSPNGMLPCQILIPAPDVMTGKRFVLVGSLPQLGNWDNKLGLQLAAGADGFWRADVMLPPNQKVEAKVVLVDQNGQSRWEGGANRILDLQAPSEPGRTLILMHHNVPGSTHVIFEPDAPNRAFVPLTPDVNATVRFIVPYYQPQTGQQLMLVGSHPAMGAWSPKGGVMLKELPGHTWEGQVDMPITATSEAKLVLIEADGRTTWEPGPNRQVVASGGARGIPPTSLGATTIATMQWGAFQSTPTVMVPRLIPSFTSPNATPIPMPYDQPTTYSTPYTAPAANPYSAPTPATPAADPLLAAAADGGMMKLLTLVVGRFAGNGGGAPTPEQILQATREAAAAMGPNNGMAAAMSQLQGDVGSELLARARLELSQAMAQDVAQVTPGSSRSPELLPASGKAQASVTPAEPAAAMADILAVPAAPRPRGRPRKEGTPRRASPMRALGPIPEEMAPYEAHVMAILAMYPGCTLDRLQAMMCASTVPPKYEKSPEQLGVLLTYLVAQGTVTGDNGEFKLRDIASLPEVPRPRKRSPSPRAPSVETAAAAADGTATAEAPAPEVKPRRRRASSKSPIPEGAAAAATGEQVAVAAEPKPRRRRSTSVKAAEVLAAAAAEAAAALAATTEAEAAEGGASSSSSSSSEGGKDLGKYEIHVLAILKGYSSCTLDRLHSLMRTSAASTGYDEAEEDLGRFMASLVEQGKVLLDGDLYMSCGPDGKPTRRRATPRTSRKTPPPAAATVAAEAEALAVAAPAADTAAATSEAGAATTTFF